MVSARHAQKTKTSINMNLFVEQRKMDPQSVSGMLPYSELCSFCKPNYDIYFIFSYHFLNIYEFLQNSKIHYKNNE